MLQISLHSYACRGAAAGRKPHPGGPKGGGGEEKFLGAGALVAYNFVTCIPMCRAAAVARAAFVTEPETEIENNRCPL